MEYSHDYYGCFPKLASFHEFAPRINLVRYTCTLNNMQWHICIFSWLLFWFTSTYCTVTKENMVRVSRWSIFYLFVLLHISFMLCNYSRFHMSNDNLWFHSFQISSLWLFFTFLINNCKYNSFTSPCIHSLTICKHYWSFWRILCIWIKKIN